MLVSVTTTSELLHKYYVTPQRWAAPAANELINDVTATAPTGSRRVSGKMEVQAALRFE